MLNQVSTLLFALFFAAAAAADDGAFLRYQEDVARERGWALTMNGVMVLDLKNRRTLAEIELPQWTWAGEAFACAPDLALGPSGEAVISSNVVPVLWRVDPVTLAVTRHAPVLDAHADKDVGFTGLAFSAAQNAFYAVSDFGALWRIDPLLRRAQEVALSEPMLRACGVSVRVPKGAANRFFGLCVRGPHGEWTVNLAPDRRSGYVLTRAPAHPC